MKQIAIIWAMILLVAVSSSWAGEAPGKFLVLEIKFVGVENVLEKDLAKSLATKTPPWWKVWSARSTVTPIELDEDLMRIKQFYQEQGYYRTECTYKVDGLDHLKNPVQVQAASDDISSDPFPKTDPIESGIKVAFHVTEGPPVIIKSIDFKMKGKVPETSEQAIIGLLPIKTGYILELAKYREAKKVILSHLGNTGRPLAKLTGRVLVDTNENQAKVNFEVNPGPKCSFGPITISGNDGYVNDVVIQRAMAFKSGEVYSSDKVEKSQRNLVNMNVFGAAIIKPGNPSSGSDQVPMAVEVKPQKQQSAKMGVGYGNEDGVRVKGTYTYRNILGWAGNLSLTARRSDLLENAQADYNQPYFWDSQNTFHAQTGYEREKLDSYTNQKIFARAFVDRVLNPYWTVTPGYSLEVNRPQDISIADPDDFDRIATGQNYFVSSLQFAVKRDTTDNQLNPTKGSVISVSVEQAMVALGSELSYCFPTVELKQYQPLAHRLILASRVRFRTIQRTEGSPDIPIFKRLFLGGANTVRGYDYQKLGPLDRNGNPVGGLSSFDGNLEIRFPIYKEISGVVFWDMGLVDKDSIRYNLGDLRYSVGTGLRYDTIVGPVRIDFGWKVNPPTLDDLGELADPNKQLDDPWKIHFSIGQAF
ncbi:MAG: BamA/TamA family outer membrane protein [Deltaproteobacteria bacterium]|nr:BamA/TamA family outer membrane protein [Deltaproteobacteria bacterium]